MPCMTVMSPFCFYAFHYIKQQKGTLYSEDLSQISVSQGTPKDHESKDHEAKDHGSKLLCAEFSAFMWQDTLALVQKTDESI